MDAQLHLCSHETATSFHVKHFKGHKCLDEWPRIDENGVLHIGATGTLSPMIPLDRFVCEDGLGGNRAEEV